MQWQHFKARRPLTEIILVTRTDRLHELKNLLRGNNKVKDVDRRRRTSAGVCQGRPGRASAVIALRRGP